MYNVGAQSSDENDAWGLYTTTHKQTICGRALTNPIRLLVDI